jgi:hypothetical protein
VLFDPADGHDVVVLVYSALLTMTPRWPPSYREVLEVVCDLERDAYRSDSTPDLQSKNITKPRHVRS